MDDFVAKLEAERILADVPGERVFRLRDSAEIGNLEDLYSALRSMPEDIFSHHVNNEKNDFGNWIRDVHKDYRLANSLFSSTTKEECLIAVGQRIYELEKSLEPAKSLLLLPAPAKEGKEAAPLEERLMNINDIISPEAASIAAGDTIEIEEERGLITGFFADMQSVFSRDGFAGFASELKGIFVSEKVESPGEFVKSLSASGDEGADKDRIIDHLKRVYR
ncbi:hypothetical protein HZB90_03420 [archaeon]|nr:hypothetical protein [archaeon]